MTYAEIQEEVVRKYKIDLCDGTKCKDGDWSRTHTHTKKRRVCKWKKANSIQSTFTLFHEIGHIVHNWTGQRRCEQEYTATTWAIAECAKYGLKIPDSIIEDYQDYIYRERDRGIRRGGSSYPSAHALNLKAHMEIQGIS